METIFNLCVEALMWAAALIGCTYKEINVVIFCIIEPIVFLFLIVRNYRLNRTIKRLKSSPS